jgi:hypothetical protein
MQPEKRFHLPTVVMPGLASIALSPTYLTLKKQKTMSDKFMTAIRKEEKMIGYQGCAITPQILEYETDFTLTQLRAAACLYLPREPDRHHLLLDFKFPAIQFQGSYDMHWDDLIALVRLFNFCSKIFKTKLFMDRLLLPPTCIAGTL